MKDCPLLKALHNHYFDSKLCEIEDADLRSEYYSAVKNNIVYYTESLKWTQEWFCRFYRIRIILNVLLNVLNVTCTVREREQRE